MKNLKSQYILPFLVGLLPLVAIFINERFVPFIIIGIVLSTILEKNIKNNFLENKRFLLPYLIYVLTFVLFTIVSSDIKISSKVLERQTSMILIPLILFSCNWNKERLVYILRIYICCLTIIFFLSLGKLFWFIYNFNDWIQTMNLNSNSYTYVQFKFPHLIGAHPTYWSYLLIVANLFLLSNNYLKIFSKKGIIILMLIIFNFNLLILSARTPLLINVLIHVWALVLYFRKNTISSRKLISIISLALVGAILSFNIPLLRAKIHFIIDDERFFLWPLAYEKIQENYFILGEGLGLGNQIFKNYILIHGDPRTIYHGFDLHNQYLTQWLDMGILGLTSLVYLILYPCTKISKLISPKSFMHLGFTMLFIISLNTESSLYRLNGVIIYSVFSSILLLLSKFKN
ncbi:O-antigen ligase family protein [Arenibacter sp. BSSL-BM3]|uniref:O-antigen ligase family protein n=1 Tax=Arenibacter arenosicollis TaxID=2762274 RepID=A0ABR7QIB4_9FLAO|nr:O-antigen ligase family protein [Arenibacter arenosicollis]MBC8766910.1 O-antigen ligase family protein [Arenibacter arenosicollis]